MRTYTTLAIFIIFALGSFWFLQDITSPPVSDKESNTHFPDYFMEDFSITQMNLQGQPEYVLKAIKMLHYADDDSSELEQPFISITQADAKMTLRASRAIYLQQQNIIYLHDNVVIHRDASKTQSELTIYTDYLKIDTQAHIAQTNLAARVTTAEAELNSIGLIFDNKQGTLKLQSKVKGVYEAVQ